MFGHLQILQIIWRQAYFYINMVLFIDLLCIIREPFKPQNSRLKWYIICMVLYLTLWTSCLKFYLDLGPDYILFFRSVAILVSFIVTIICLLSIICLLQRPGTNKNLKK